MATVLIVDDSRTSRKILRGLLERAGFVITGEAVNGEDGYLKYKELQPDVVTMDITMPVMDGIQAMVKIREKSNVPVILLTAAIGVEKRIETLEIGERLYIKQQQGSKHHLPPLTVFREKGDELGKLPFAQSILPNILTERGISVWCYAEAKSYVSDILEIAVSVYCDNY